MKQKVFIAMSGGVDSSVAAWLLREQGYDCTGGMMKLMRETDENASGCCSLADSQDARSVAFKIGIPFYVFNDIEAFQTLVIDKFVRAYFNGQTPNPCIDCNRFLKFDRFLKRAQDVGAAFIATGHYARIAQDAASGRFLLKKGIDPHKDQSYVLYGMTQHQLAHTQFPLGALHKTDVRKIAFEQGFINAEKRDSQDICFVPKGRYGAFIQSYTGAPSPSGPIRDTRGALLGTHDGIVHYTVGQRKGLGLTASAPLYVSAIVPETNTVVVGYEKALYARSMIVDDINLIPFDRLQNAMRAKVKIRYKQPEQDATLFQEDAQTIRVVFDSPQRAITKGQAAVFYDGDIVVGGGRIQSTQ